ncbi:hypothetical protein WJX72_004061 [[Myrmecia] bisecta]|uniref:Uncharacterized protein n=1 Tax=[Myrmecia] bisecta TaxID=41462 RepID=A0AAW1Q0Y3_9CHLO
MYDPGYGHAPPARSRKERKVSVLFRRTETCQHCAGVNALALSTSGEHIYTASRDSTIKKWQTRGADNACEASFEGHVDWVNDVVVVQEALVSCSSDRMLQVWQANGTGTVEPMCTLMQHSDYAIALAAAPSQAIVASAGLCSEVFLWDLNAAIKVAVQGQAYRPSVADQQRQSVYALALNEHATLLAVGSTENVIGITDCRSGQKMMRLRGHTDNVRALLVNAEGTLCLSGSSDHTIKLWDLGQQRCLQTFAVHTDSVWTMLASPDFGVVYSGGRDRCVYRTQLANRTSELICCESGPVLDMAMADVEAGMWVATTSSTVRRWPVEPKLPPAASFAATLRASFEVHSLPAMARSLSTSGGNVFPVGNSPLVRSRQTFDGALTPSPQQQQPATSLLGIPPICQSQILTDRRHILTRDSGGFVALWDVTTGTIVRQYGQADFKQVESELFQPISLPAWFALDSKLGSLAVHLETPQCFSAEAYANDLGYEDAPDDQKLNFGERMLQGLFAQWSAGLSKSLSRQRSLSQGQAHPQSNSPSRQNSTSSSGQDGRPDADGFVVRRSLDEAQPRGDADGNEAAAPSSDSECFHFRGSLPPNIMCTMEGDGAAWDGQPWSRLTTQFSGQEAIGQLVPTWVAEAVLRRRYPASPELKCAFVLHPEQGSELPSLLQSRLNAPRILRIHKVASYAASKLAEQNIHLAIVPVLWHERLHRGQDACSSSPQQMQTDEAAVTTGTLELICNGMAVPYDMSLAAVRTYIWKRSDDLLLLYRILKPHQPAPLPNIRPLS